LSTVTAIDRLYEALREDADWVMTAVTPQQRSVIDGVPEAKPAAATWAGSPEHEAALRAEREAYIAAHRREWGRYPDV
jgi:hypothetical protein